MGPDELLLQTDELDDEYWCLMDGGGDLVALAVVDGANEAWVVRQWTYDAYGAILTAEHLGPSLETHVGHKGLFMDRLDVAMGYGSYRCALNAVRAGHPRRACPRLRRSHHWWLHRPF